MKIAKEIFVLPAIEPFSPDIEHSKEIDVGKAISKRTYQWVGASAEESTACFNLVSPAIFELRMVANHSRASLTCVTCGTNFKVTKFRLLPTSFGPSNFSYLYAGRYCLNFHPNTAAAHVWIEPISVDNFVMPSFFELLLMPWKISMPLRKYSRFDASSLDAPWKVYFAEFAAPARCYPEGGYNLAGVTIDLADERSEWVGYLMMKVVEKSFCP